MIFSVGVGLLLTAGNQQVAFLPADSVRTRRLDVDDGFEKRLRPIGATADPDGRRESRPVDAEQKFQPDRSEPTVLYWMAVRRIVYLSLGPPRRGPDHP
jgi:hypothetical protein